MDQPGTRSPRYSAVAIGLHWAIAGMLLGLIWLGWNMHDAEGNPVKWTYQLHKSIGITVLLLTIARVIWRVKNPPPPLPEELKSWERTASHAVHMAFYAIMILIPLGGWAMVSVSSFQYPTFLFGAVQWPHVPFITGLSVEAKAWLYDAISLFHTNSDKLILALLALHIGGALKHEFSEEDGVLKRMIPGLFGKTGGPAAPPTGFLVAFGSAFAAFAIVSGSPVIAQTIAGNADVELTQSEIAANWDVDPQASEIAFALDYKYFGESYTLNGTFDTWIAQIAFDETDLASSEVSVSVDLSDVSGLDQSDREKLKDPEWLNTAEHPQALVALGNFAASETGYTSTAALTLKGLTVEVPFDFSLAEEDGKTVMTGETVFTRTSLNLGQSTYPDDKEVKEEIRVSVMVTATPK